MSCLARIPNAKIIFETKWTIPKFDDNGQRKHLSTQYEKHLLALIAVCDKSWHFAHGDLFFPPEITFIRSLIMDYGPQL